MMQLRFRLVFIAYKSYPKVINLGKTPQNLRDNTGGTAE